MIVDDLPVTAMMKIDKRALVAPSPGGSVSETQPDAIQPVGTGDSSERPIKLGSMLFTLVEPHAGHEVAYNRWYERDHFYAGCMIGAWTVAGARFVATKECKERRYPADSPITPDPLDGSYLALYWILAGKLDEWMRWGTDQVNWLHANGRMFPDRDHVHTLMYELADERSAHPDGVPAELALDRRYPGIVATIGEVADGHTVDEVIAWSAARECPADLVLTFTPRPLFDDAPGDVPARHREQPVHPDLVRRPTTRSPRSTSGSPPSATDLAASGLGEIVFASPFLATVPGTDTYTDQLR